MVRLQLLSAFLSLFLSASSASSVANFTTINYQSEPKTRGTIGLLLSCTVTLVLCVWTALHLNIEPLEFSRSKHAGASRLVGKVIWGLTALVAPELVLSIALHQFLFAWQYRKVLNTSWVSRDKTNGRGGEVDYFGGAAEAEEMGSKPEVGLKMAFYAIMGGFAVESTKSFAVTLDMDMLENDATVEKIRYYPIAKIDDKDKADYLAKVLACVQACWIVLQCLGRKLNGLPITLLELNTVLHVVNAVVMYGLWWEKPVDVGQPSIIGQSEEEWENESVEMATYLPVDILLISQQRVKERIVPLLRSADGHSRLLAAQIDGCNLSDDILDKLEGLSAPVKHFKIVAGVVAILAHLLVTNIHRFFGSRGAPEILEEMFGKAFGEAFGEAFCEALGEGSVDVPGHSYGEFVALGASVAEETFRKTFPKTFRAGISRPYLLPVIHARKLRNGFREAVRAAATFVLEAANSDAGSSVPLYASEAACSGEIINYILPVSPSGVTTSQGDARKYFEDVASNADLFPTVYEAIKKENRATMTTDGGSSRYGTQQRIYEKVFLHVRQRALNIANDESKRDEVRAAAFKAAFHLDPRVVRRPADVESPSLGILEQLVPTLSDGGRHIRNQFVQAPGIFGEGAELEWFDRRWCNTHRAVLLAFATCSGAFYGGMHSFGRNDHFPSESEKRLFEFSICIGAAGVVPLTALAVILWTRPPWLVSRLCWTLFVLSGLAFLTARTFLIVESFISVRDLPVGAYETVQWAEAIPHI